MNSSFSAKKLISLFASAVVVLFLIENCSPSSPAEMKSNEAESAPEAHLGEMMGQMQYYFVKLGLALQHRNKTLANFYAGEWNEVYEDIASKNITDKGINISSMITQILGPRIKELNNTVARNDTTQFDAAYHAVIASCNNCHIETNHDFIVIEEPHGDFIGQNFGALHSEFSE
jgi:hypothetical protein